MKIKKLITAVLLLTLILSLAGGCSGKDPEIPQSDPGDANYFIFNIRDFGTITVKLYPEYAPETYALFVANVREGFYNGRNFHRIISDFMMQGGAYSASGASNPDRPTVFTETHPDARHYYGALCLAANYLGYGGDSFYIVNNNNTNVIEERIGNILEQFELEDTYRMMYDDEIVDDYFNRLQGQLDSLYAIPENVKARYAEVGGTPELDDDYTVFGYTVDGFDVIDAVSAVETILSDPANPGSEKSKPTRDIIIEWAIVKTALD